MAGQDHCWAFNTQLPAITKEFADVILPLTVQHYVSYGGKSAAASHITMIEYMHVHTFLNYFPYVVAITSSTPSINKCLASRLSFW
eukprot:scaffold209791_cov42-Prasinocladus_malaysianus.AAC.4